METDRGSGQGKGAEWTQKAAAWRAPGTPADIWGPAMAEAFHAAARLRHLSRRTETCYRGWVRRFFIAQRWRNPSDLGQPEVVSFLSDLATRAHVSASTQNQALAALLFLYQVVLGQGIPWLDDLVRAKRPHRVPVVLTRREVLDLLDHMQGTPRVVATLVPAVRGTGRRGSDAGDLRAGQRGEFWRRGT